MNTLAAMGFLLLYHVWKRFQAMPIRTQVPDPSTPNLFGPQITFLVPAWNGLEDIRGFIHAFGDLSYRNRQLVLSAGGNDGSLETALALADSNTIVIEQRTGEGKQRALCNSYRHATGELIYLTDIDCRPSDAVVFNLAGKILRGEATVVTGGSRPLDDQMSDSFVCVQWAMDQATEPKEVTSVKGLLGRNTILTRDIVNATGSFSTDAPSGTDYTLAQEVLRAGSEIRFVPGYPMPTRYPEDMKTYIGKQARWIRNVFVLGRRYGATSDVRGSMMTMVFAYSLVMAGLIGLVRRVVLSVGFLLSVHAILNRIEQQRQVGMAPGLLASVKHFLATQAAALRASRDIVTQRSSW